MDAVVSFKVPVEVKKKMKKWRKKINWSKELRHFLIQRIRELEKEEALNNAVKIIEETEGVPEKFGAKSVREDRDSG